MYDDYEFDPKSVRRGFFRWLPVSLVILACSLAVIGGLVFAGHELGWWLAAKNADHQAQVTQDGYANQTTLREQVTAKIADVESMTAQIAQAGGDQSMADAVRVQRAAVAAIACEDASETTGDPLPAPQAAWVAANCKYGSVSPASTYYVNGS